MSRRIRSIKPEILEDERSAGLSSDAWRLWVSMWLMADDLGHVRGEPRQLHAAVFWAAPVPPSVPDLLGELEHAGSIRRYAVRGQRYIEICNWSKHQRIDNANRKALLPGPDETEGFSHAASRREPPRAAAGLDLDGIGEERSSEQSAHAGSLFGEADAPKVSRFDFDAVYSVFPRKRGKSAGYDKLESDIKSEADYYALGIAVRNFASAMAEEKRPADKIPYFSTWVNEWRDWVQLEQNAVIAQPPWVAELAAKSEAERLSPRPRFLLDEVA